MRNYSFTSIKLINQFSSALNVSKKQKSEFPDLDCYGGDAYHICADPDNLMNKMTDFLYNSVFDSDGKYI